MSIMKAKELVSTARETTAGIPNVQLNGVTFLVGYINGLLDAAIKELED